MDYANTCYYKTINNELASIEQILLDRIESLAKKIILGNHCITGYCRAMGSASFSIEYSYIPQDEDEYINDDEFLSDYDEFIEFYDHLQNNTDSNSIESFNCMDEIKELTYIMDEYNHIFMFVGNPLKIDKQNDELIIKTDW